MDNWNWIKIKTVADLPPFDRPVLLYEKKDGKEYAVVGSLKSVDGSGYNWKVGGSSDIFNFNDIFGMKTPSPINPSHWCEIQRPINE